MINALGARESGLVQLATTVLEFVPLAMIGIVGLFFIHAPTQAVRAARPQPEPAVHHRGADPVGVHRARVGDGPAEEVYDPERTIPRATILGTGITTLLYIVATVAIRASSQPPRWPARRARSPTPPASLRRGWDKVIALVAMVSTFGALNGWILLQGRVPLAAAEDGHVPAAFARVQASAGRRSSALSSPPCWSPARC